MTCLDDHRDSGSTAPAARTRRATTSLAVCGFASLMLLAGCGYMLGSPYQAEVRSVYIPTFGNQTFRRGLEFQVTEAVQKEVKNRTPFLIAKPPYADTVLRGNIISLRKDVLGESQFDDPRELQVSLAVELTWEDLRTGQILAQQQMPVTPDLVHVLADATFAPEIGQSLATGQQQAIDRLARQIVNMMETPW